MKTRIYVVQKTNGFTRLVEATSASQAIRHCALGEYAAKVASSTDVAHAMQGGAKVEAAGSEAAGESTPAT